MSPLIKSILLAAAFVVAMPFTASAQSLSPLEREGMTPSDRKAFRLVVGNPYNRRMTFVLVPTEPDYSTPARGVVVNHKRLTLAPGFSRQVIVTFDIDPAKGERTIALCVMPEAIDGPVLPRVCGRYAGHMAGRGG
jgi:hypothetical protein